VNAGRRGRPFGRRRTTAKAPTDPEAARLDGIGMLARSDLARRALRDRLVERGYERGAAEEAVALLADERLVDDARFVSNRIASRVARGHGPRRIRLELEQDGLEKGLVDVALKASRIDWNRQALIVLTRRFGGEPPVGPTERAARARFLYYRGFGGDAVRSAFAALGLESPAEADEEPMDLAGGLDEDVDF
jgi:regulatory protein